jgi:carbamoyl-phosphate synthase small subunit
VPLTNRQHPAKLILEDGSIFTGYAFAGEGEVLGEVVFNTGMTGYQEIITDPSYKGQIVTMTYPLIGNYGINPDDMESGNLHLEGLVVKEYESRPSNYRSRQSLKDFLDAHGTLGVEGIDTRALTRRIRQQGAMRGLLTTIEEPYETMLSKVRAYPGLVGRDLVKEVSCKGPYVWQQGMPRDMSFMPTVKKGCRVVVLDCGVKYNILRHLESRHCEVIVLPCTAGAQDIMNCSPDGVLLSNGPGDPAALPYIVTTVKNLLGRIPVFGICLGHQILGQALGGKTEKLKFGHHGINQPVKNRQTGRIEITSQNHGFVVVPESLPSGIDKTHDNLNDKTSEGMGMTSIPAFSVQYHPEAAPGPHDVVYLFDQFVSLMNTERV